jgi:integrase
MSVYPRADGIYCYDFQVKRVRFCGTTGVSSRREAEAVERTAREQAKKQVAAIQDQRIGPLTVSAAFDRFWMEVGQRYEGTYRDLVWWSLGWMIEQLGPNTLIRNIGQNRLTELIARRRAMTFRGKLVSNATVNRSITELLKRILCRANSKWEQQVAPIDWRGMKLKEPKERVRELREGEETALYERMRDDYAPAVRFKMVSGLRKKEVVALGWPDIDWRVETVAVRGKGNKLATIPLTTEIAEILRPLLGHHPEAVFTYVCQRPRRGAKTRWDAKVPKDTEDGRERVRGQRYPITKAGLASAWRRHGGPAAGIKDFRLHDLRHTAATRLLRDSGNLKLVQKLLRHENIATTAKYAHADDADLRAAMEALTNSRQKSRTKSRKLRLVKG